MARWHLAVAAALAALAAVLGVAVAAAAPADGRVAMRWMPVPERLAQDEVRDLRHAQVLCAGPSPAAGAGWLWGGYAGGAGDRAHARPPT
eukprot:16344130-Heterocapsa_arctica.AAC.1